MDSLDKLPQKKSMNQRKLFKFLFYVALISITSGCSNKNESIKTLFGTNLSQETIDNFIDKQMESLNIPALSIAIINDGKVVYHRVKGFADIEKQILADNNSIFEGASISKSVFGFFVMTFVEDGLLDLDKPLFQYLPNPDIEDDERYKKITARIVLSHRSGFPNWRTDYPDKKLFIQFEPGTAYHYSGEGYQYLAEVLKHLLDTNWAGLEEEFEKRVAIPYKMYHTKFIKDEYIRENKVQPYDKDGNWVDKSKEEWWVSRDSVFVAPTTIHSEAIDFSKWMIAMMNKQGLSEKGFQELYKPHSKISSGFLKEDYTLGLSKLSILNLGELYQHSGNNTGFSSYFSLDKDKKWGLVFFTNCKAGDQFALNLTHKLLLLGSVRKQIAVGLTLIFATVLLTTNLILFFFNSQIIQEATKTNFLIGVITLLSCLLSLVLMLTKYYTFVPYIYVISIIVVLTLGFKALNITKMQWEENNGKKVLLFFQTNLVLGILISAITAGFLQ